MEIEYPGIIEIRDKSFEKVDTFYPGNVIVNDKGIYGDWLINKFGDENILKYPLIDYLKNNIQNLMKDKKIILLLDSQKQEIDFLKTIFPLRYLELDMDLLLEALGTDLVMGDIWKLAKTKPYYRILYFILRYKFNPSFMFTVDPKQPYLPYVDDIKKLNLPFSSEYLENGDFAEQIFSDVILDLAYIDDLMKNEDLKKIIEDNLISKSTRTWLINNNKIKEDWKYNYLN
jgi:hypothetical protein